MTSSREISEGVHTGVKVVVDAVDKFHRDEAEFNAALYERSQAILDVLTKIAEAVDRPHRYIVRLRNYRGGIERYDMMAFSARDAVLQAEMDFRNKTELMPHDQVQVLEIRPADDHKDGPRQN